jgi:hypothetical protein
MSNKRSDNKVIPLDPPLSEKELEEALDLFYQDCARIKLIKQGFWDPSEDEEEVE